MSFLKNEIFLKKINKQCFLQMQRSIRNEISDYIEERTSLSTSPVERKNLDASITVEAAIVSTIFLVTMISIISIMLILELDMTLQQKIETTAWDMGKNGYVTNRLLEDYGDGVKSRLEEITEPKILDKLKEWNLDKLLIDTTTALHIQNTVKNNLGNRLDNSILVNGVDGISFLGTEQKDESVTVRLSYKIKLPLISKLVGEILISQGVTVRMWTGKSVRATEDNATIVYVTLHGVVYHMDINCTHLAISSKSVSMDKIGQQRSAFGGKYSICDKCGQEAQYATQVYITDEGNKYHIKLSCSGLKRSIIEKRFEDVQGLGACMRCGLNGNK